jgi:undecaprenyl-phosphate 4-deoxy-4-formamido-L-arabinose transferase
MQGASLLDRSPEIERGVSVVVPVYNEAEMIPELVERLQTVLDELGERYEIIFVNDGSADGTWECVLEQQRLRPFVLGIDLMRNHGQHNALLAGIRAASYSSIVTVDADLQNPPEEMPKLLAKLDEGYDVVYGTPDHERHGLWRDMASRVTKFALQTAMGAETARQVSAYRALRSEVRQAFSGYRSPYVNLDVLLTWATSRFAAVVVRHEPRQVGKSKYRFSSLVTHAVNMITGFSVLPLQMASMIGFVFTCFGLAVLAYVVGRYFLQGGAAPGFPFLASIIAIFSGAQLFAIGMIGEYLARMHFRLMDRPPYTVRSHPELVGAFRHLETFEERFSPEPETSTNGSPASRELVTR